MYFTRPALNTTYHIFGDDDRALCGKWMMWSKDPEMCEPVKGNEVYRKGNDCKTCFRKAGLSIDA